MGDDRLKTRYRTFVGQQDLLIQVQGIFCCICRELKPFTQACLSELEALRPLIGDPCRLPFRQGAMHLRLLHGLHDPVDGRGTQDHWNPGGEPAGVVQDEDNLRFVIMGQAFDLNSH